MSASGAPPVPGAGARRPRRGAATRLRAAAVLIPAQTATQGGPEAHDDGSMIRGRRGVGDDLAVHQLVAPGVAERVLVGDLQDFEDSARAAGAELLVTHSHGRQASERLDVPLLRVGFPIFDRLGAMHRCTAGYQGTLNLIFEVSNIILSGLHEHAPGDFAQALPIIEETRHAGATSATC